MVAAYSLLDQQGAFLTSYNALSPTPETFVSTAGATPRQTLGMLGIYKKNEKTSGPTFIFTKQYKKNWHL